MFKFNYKLSKEQPYYDDIVKLAGLIRNLPEGFRWDFRAGQYRPRGVRTAECGCALELADFHDAKYGYVRVPDALFIGYSGVVDREQLKNTLPDGLEPVPDDATNIQVADLWDQYIAYLDTI